MYRTRYQYGMIARFLFLKIERTCENPIGYAEMINLVNGGGV